MSIWVIEYRTKGTDEDWLATCDTFDADQKSDGDKAR